MTKAPTTLCLYHDDCIDGFTASWVVDRYYYMHKKEKLIAYPIKYGDPINVSRYMGKHIVLVDFCFPEKELLHLCDIALSVTVLDHHQTAYDMFKKLLPDAVKSEKLIFYKPGGVLSIKRIMQRFKKLPDNLFVNINLIKTGATLAWDYYYTDQKYPEILKYIHDADLGIESREHYHGVMQYIYSCDKTYPVWNKLMFQKPTDHVFIVIGYALYTQQLKIVQEAVKETALKLIIDVYVITAVNVPRSLGQMAMMMLLNDTESYHRPFVAAITVVEEGWRIRLRSHKSCEMMMSTLAEKFGGGGHKHAASFLVRNVDLKNVFNDAGDITINEVTCPK